MQIIAVVVTYNRLILLRRTLAALQAQTRPLNAIIVVNNGATDGTGDFLASQTGITVITQENLGGSGGFHRGISEAMNLGADRIWCMDDDVFPRPECLAQMLRAEKSMRQSPAPHGTGILAPRRLMKGRIFSHDFLSYNLTNPLRSMYRGRLNHAGLSSPAAIAGTAFEGPLIRREVVERIGLPNRDLFIFCDDTDYCLRAHQAGFGIAYIPTALMDKEPFFTHDTWATRERKKKWKRFYQVRNAAYLNHHYGHNAGVRYGRSLISLAGYLFTALCCAPFGRGWSWGDLPRLWRAYSDGVHERLGKM